MSREVVGESLDRATLSHKDGSCSITSVSQEFDLHEEIDSIEKIRNWSIQAAKDEKLNADLHSFSPSLDNTQQDKWLWAPRDEDSTSDEGIRSNNLGIDKELSGKENSTRYSPVYQ